MIISDLDYFNSISGTVAHQVDGRGSSVFAAFETVASGKSAFTSVVLENSAYDLPDNKSASSNVIGKAIASGDNSSANVSSFSGALVQL